MKRRIASCWLIAELLFAAAVSASEAPQRLTIPEVAPGTPRLITVEDLAALRRADTLSVSPDGRRYAVLVRQGDHEANKYRTAWFVGSVEGGPLTFVSDGGDAVLARTGAGGRVVGNIEKQPVQWSPDSRWIAYRVPRGGEVQLWRGRADGGRREQLTRNPADVRDFVWSEDGQSLYFTVGTSRAELQARMQARERAGYQYDEDLNVFSDFMLPQMDGAAEPATAVWTVSVKGHRERLANDSERAAFERARKDSRPGMSGTIIPPAQRVDGARVWVQNAGTHTRDLRVHASFPDAPSNPIPCMAEECSGYIERVWWGDDGTAVFLRREGISNSGQGLYSWAPLNGTVAAIRRFSDDYLWSCDLAANGRLVCVRETPTLPHHIVAVALRSSTIEVLADLNPELRNISLGRVERLEWDTPQFPWSEPGQPLAGLYAERAYGYIVYPPDFVSGKKYPVFINPYSAVGFDNATNVEYPAHALAAGGMIVLNTNFPRSRPERLGSNAAKLMQLIYSPELDFPHLTMYMESTLRALDTVAARGFVDLQRVGIGGVSHGTFVPLYLVQKHDRIAAVSISGGTWSQYDYYMLTGRGQGAAGSPESWQVKPVGAGLDFWRRFDLADNVETIEAPILMNVPASETFLLIRLIKHMGEAGKPYDAYVFPDETHMKWQPAHLYNIAQRNVDWFRFWLQDREDADPAKAGQYQRWRKLREQHQANQRAEP